MTKKLFLILFAVILFVGATLRVYDLGAVPGSLDWDEVSYGYNAYSLLQTGKDEYGVSYPFTFEAFGEYKQPVYAYLEVASVGIFGLSPFAVRFPSAIFGILGIIFVYLFVRELFRKYSFSQPLALLSAASFALSPWSIQFSRGAFEANVALCLVISAMWLFLRGIATKVHWQLFLATILLGVSQYTYISEKLITPFLFIALLLYSFTYLKKNKKVLVSLVLVFVLLSSLVLLNTKSVSRGEDVLFTGQQTQLLESSIKELEHDKATGDVWGQIIHNRRVVYAEKFAQNYLSHFNPVWLFLTGDPTVNRHHAPGMGVLYLVSLPFILLGIFFLFSRALKQALLFGVWLLVAPLASSFTSEAPHALRSLIFLPTWQILEAAGVIFVLQLISKKPFRRSLLTIILCFYLVNIGYFIHQYFVHTNTEYQKDWQYGYKEAVQFAAENPNQRVVFSNAFEQPYIFYLFYNRYDPAKYLSTGGSNRREQKCFNIENSYFGDCRETLKSNDIYIAIEEEPNEKRVIVEQIRYTNGKPGVTIYKQL